MRMAVKKALAGMKKGGGPFGACIVNEEGRVVACEGNSVVKGHSPVRHAEINAIEKACRKRKNHLLKNCTIYSTTEPCPMCFGAIHWAGIGKIVYGTEIKDAKKAGLRELCISAERMKRMGKSRVKIMGGFLKEEAKTIFEEWRRLKGRVNY